MAADQSMPILVVADYQTTVCIVTNLLKQIGYACIDVAASGPAALGKMRNKSYGLVIADWRLQQSPRGEVLAEIRAGAQFDRTPILMLAPQSQAAHVGAVLAAGCDGYLFMPFNAATLQNTIDATIAAHPGFAGSGLTTQADALLRSA